MFKRKSCPRCGKNLKGRYDFCPFCGSMLEGKERDYGILGKSDSQDLVPNQNIFPMGLGSIFNSLMRNIEREFRNPDPKEKPKNQGNVVPNGISISISSFPGFPQQMKMNSANDNKVKNNRRKHEEIKRFFFGNFSSEKFKNLSKLPKEEPKANTRRLDNRIIYEIELPEVKSDKDIAILNLENSMELKAVADKKVYSKLIPMSFPILNYSFSKGKLILELDAGGN